MNNSFSCLSINWPASSVWVLIAQLEEHCSVNAEAMGLNPVKALEKPSFLRAILQLLKLRFTAMITYSFYLYSRSSQFTVEMVRAFCQQNPHLEPLPFK